MGFQHGVYQQMTVTGDAANNCYLESSRIVKGAAATTPLFISTRRWTRCWNANQSPTAAVVVAYGRRARRSIKVVCDDLAWPPSKSATRRSVAVS
jgi:hypothetical protein